MGHKRGQDARRRRVLLECGEVFPGELGLKGRQEEMAGRTFKWGALVSKGPEAGRQASCLEKGNAGVWGVYEKKG